MGLRLDSAEELRAVYDGATVAVTGGAGFIGSHLVDALLALGATVQIIDDLSTSDAGHIAEIVEAVPGRVRFVYASILDPAALAETLAGCAQVFHLAAMASVTRSLENPHRCFEVNVHGTLRVAEAARSAGVRSWVSASSSSVYGASPELPKHEEMLPDPLSPYAASKSAGEQVVRAWAHSRGLPGCSLRFFNVFGARQAADSAYAAVIPAFLASYREGRAPIIEGDGLNSRDFTHVDNAVIALLLAGTRELNGEAINVGCGGRTTVLELAERLARICGVRDAEPLFAPARPGDVPHSVADLTLARKLLGYAPVTGLDEGLTRTARAFGCTSPVTN